MSLGKPTIKSCFMDDEMRDFAVNEATKALETSNSEKVRNTQIEVITIVALLYSWSPLT